MKQREKTGMHKTIKMGFIVLGLIITITMELQNGNWTVVDAVDEL